MLETSQERVELLKAGISGPTIEKLYLICNNFKIVRSPVLFERAEVDVNEREDNCVNREAPAQYGEVLM